MKKFVGILAMLALPIALIIRVFTLLIAAPFIIIWTFCKSFSEVFIELFDITNTLSFVRAYINQCYKIYKGY